MEVENNQELLCIKGKNRNYAFDFSCIQEICKGLEMSEIPCLPSLFAGVCNYKGEIVPVVYLEEGAGGAGDEMTLIFHYKEYYLGMLYQGKTFILPAENFTVIRQPEGELTGGIWAGRAMLQAGGELYLQADPEKTIQQLADFFRVEFLRKTY